MTGRIRSGLKKGSFVVDWEKRAVAKLTALGALTVLIGLFALIVAFVQSGLGSDEAIWTVG